MRVFIFILLFLLHNEITAQITLNESTKDWNNLDLSDSIRINAGLQIAGKIYLYSNPDSALYFSNKVFELAEKGKFYNEMANAKNILGVINKNKGNYQEALAYYEESLQIFKKLNNTKGISHIYNNLGVIYDLKKDASNALIHFKKSLEAKIQLKDSLGISNSLNNIGVTLLKSGDYTESLNYFYRSKLIAEKLNDKRRLFNALNNIGNILFDQGNVNKSLEIFNNCLEICDELKDIQSKSSVYNNIGNSYKLLGNYSKAKDSYQLSLSFGESLNDSIAISRATAAIGRIYEDIGDFEMALVYFQKFYDLAESMKYETEIAVALNDLAYIQQVNKNYDEALFNLEKSLKLIDENENKRLVSYTLNQIGTVYLSKEKYENARAYFFKSIDIRNELETPFAASFSYAKIGESYLKEGKYKEAIQFSNNALTLLNETNLYKDLILATDVKAGGYLGLNQLDSAYIFLTQNVNYRIQELIDNYFTMTEGEKEKYLEAMQREFGLYFSFVINHQESFPESVNKTLEIILNTKALSLKSTTALRSSIEMSNDSSLINLYNRWIDKRIAVVNANSDGIDNKVHVLAANEMEQELSKSSENFEAISMLKNIKPEQIIKNLKKGEAAIEFVRYEIRNLQKDSIESYGYAAIVMKQNEDGVHLQKLCNESELKLILKNINETSMNYVNKIYGTQSKPQHDLYKLLWQPIVSKLNDIHTIYFSPDGMIHKLNIDALRNEESTYISDLYELKRLNSTSDLLFIKNEMISNMSSTLLMGGIDYSKSKTGLNDWNYLSGTLDEVVKINRHLTKKDKQIKYFAGEEATEEKFKKYASQKEIIHIATHGFFYPDPDLLKAELKTQSESFAQNEDNTLAFRSGSEYSKLNFVNNKNPLMRSGLVLAGANNLWDKEDLLEGEDGILTAAEISNLNLINTKLVVLSACETGLGDIKGSEGVYGLQRAFKMAGAKQIIMSLWQVPDKETSEFMNLFYKKLLKEKNTRKAFTLTQKEMRKKYDPYYWAAFVLVE